MGMVNVGISKKQKFERLFWKNIRLQYRNSLVMMEIIIFIYCVMIRKFYFYFTVVSLHVLENY